MKNSKYISICLLSMVTLLITTACTKTEVASLDSREIALNAIQQAPTKASSATIKSMGVFANHSLEPDGTNLETAWENSEFWKSVTSAAPAGNTNALYLNNVCFGPLEGRFVGIDPTTNNHIKYKWPFNGSLIFSAYSPYISENKCIKLVNLLSYRTPKDMARMDIEVVLDPTPYIDKNIAVEIDQETNEFKKLDLLWADPWHIKETSIGIQKVPVRVVFKHAMSKVTFNITNPQAQFRLTAKLINCVNHAVFHSGRTFKAPGWLPVFNQETNHSQLLDYCFYKEKSFAPNQTTFTTNIITIPMDLTGQYEDHAQSTLKPTLVLDIYNNNGVGHETISIDLSKYTQFWRPQKHYTYNIILNAQPIGFTVKVDVTADEANRDVIEM